MVGVPAGVTEDQLKALGAAAASSGAVALVHVVGVTPEAPTLRPAGLQPRRADARAEDFRSAWRELSTADDGADLAAVSLGTPHLSLAEFERLTPMVAV